MAAMPRLAHRHLGACLLLLTAFRAALAQAAPPHEPAVQGQNLGRNDALLLLDYQAIKVPGDKPIDLMGFHVHRRVSPTLFLGAGAYAPMVKGDYGGFMAFDLGAHYRRTLGGPWVATAGLAAGGGGGGRSIEQSKVLSGTGGFMRAYVGLAHDFGAYTLGLGVSKFKFHKSAIDSAQANFFVEVPYTYLAGPFTRHAQPLTPSEQQLAAKEAGENMLTLTLDNFHQQSARGSNKSTVRTADLQYAHFIAADTYWFAALGLGYKGLPIYNQLLGGFGHRVRLSPKWALYGQLGVGSGGYAPEVIDTGSGMLLYPRLSAEYSLNRDYGLAFSLGHLAATKGSSRNHTWGLALVQHLRAPAAQGGDAPVRYQGYRLTVLHQTEAKLQYRGIARHPMQMLGLQVDVPLGERWYLPIQSSVAYTDYLGYPGYGELLLGLGLQTRLAGSERWQGFGQLMAGANVHGTTTKASAGLRWVLDERLALSLSAGHVEARSASQQRFSAHTLAVGLDYRFAMPRQ